jgi:cation diffusion facilitator family transporter
MVDKNLKEIEKYRSRAVGAAFAANVAIAIVKWIAFLRSGSTSVYSEALHSSADMINSILLFIGLVSSRKPADDEHPYGYGKDAYFWALIAAIFMLGIISTSSIRAGWEHIAHEGTLTDLDFALIGLTLSILLEIVAVYIAMHSLVKSLSIQSGTEKSFKDLWKAFKESDSPAIKLVFIEDAMALSGATIALVAVGAVHFSNIHALDGLGAIIIGVMLGGLAIMLAQENRDKLIGASASDELEHKVYKTAMNYPPIRDVADLKTMVMGPSKVIAHMRIELDPETPVERMDDITAELERLIMKRVPQITDCFIEVIADEDAIEGIIDQDEDILEPGE